jgi:hypothetical protein
MNAAAAGEYKGLRAVGTRSRLAADAFDVPARTARMQQLQLGCSDAAAVTMTILIANFLRRAYTPELE